MLLQRLRDYADQRLALPPPMYQEQPIRYIFELTSEGRLLTVLDTADPASKATKTGRRALAPHIKRTVGVRAKLLCDTAVYALGIPTEGAKPERVRQQHDAFFTLVRACAERTGEASVRVVAAFLDGLNVSSLPLSADFDPSANVTFRVDGVMPIELPEVQAYWAAVQGPDDDTEIGTWLSCVVCGQVRPALPRHPLKIKGIPGGQIVKDLISANAGAFESYGLSNSLIAPTCQVCAEAYGNALNDLLAGEETHLRTKVLTFAFWAANDTGFTPGRLLSAPDPTEVRELIDSARSGRSAATTVDETAFYAVALGASGARVAVRDWIDTTVAEARRRLVTYFEAQEIVAYDGGPGEPLPIWRLANATVRDPRKEAPPATVEAALFAMALGGRPLLQDLLFQAVRRNRAEQGVTRDRAALIKMVLTTQPETTIEGNAVMPELDPTNTRPAYLCGRLLAILDAIQQRALGNPNATIVDKYYGTASSAPASVFGTLFHGAQPHLAKMRKDPRSQAAAIALDRRLQDVMESLTSFPPTLTLPEQGLFALGFYHQRAEDRRAARERREARETGVVATESEATHDEETLA